MVLAWIPVLTFLALAVVVIAVLVSVAIVVRRRELETSDTVSSAATLRIVRVGAMVYGAIGAVVTLASVVNLLVSETIQMTLPTEPFWPTPPPGVEVTLAGPAEVTGGGFMWADVAVVGLGIGVRLTLAGGILVQGLAHLAVVAAVFLLATRLLRGEPFQPTIRRAITIAAVALVAGGMLWQVLLGVGQSMAADQALLASELAWTNVVDAAFGPGADPLTLMPGPRFTVTIEFWPILTGFALMAVAAAFRQGERLQRDTVGLV